MALGRHGKPGSPSFCHRNLRSDRRISELLVVGMKLYARPRNQTELRGPHGTSPGGSRATRGTGTTTGPDARRDDDRFTSLFSSDRVPVSWARRAKRPAPGTSPTQGVLRSGPVRSPLGELAASAVDWTINQHSARANGVLTRSCLGGSERTHPRVKVDPCTDPVGCASMSGRRKASRAAPASCEPLVW